MRKIFSQLASYLLFWRTGEKPKNFNIRLMHGINKISILMFLFCLVVMVVRACR